MTRGPGDPVAGTQPLRPRAGSGARPVAAGCSPIFHAQIGPVPRTPRPVHKVLFRLDRLCYQIHQGSGASLC